MAASDVGASANPTITETLAKLGTDPQDRSESRPTAGTVTLVFGREDTG